jgi:hypothetical protein
MKTIKLYFLLISLLFCSIGCDRSQPDVNLLTIEELEAKSEELSSYSVANYTLQDSLFFTREDGFIEGFAVNVVHSGRVRENCKNDINEFTGEIIETGVSLWEYGHSLGLKNDSLELGTYIGIRQDGIYKSNLIFDRNENYKYIKTRVKINNSNISLVSQEEYSCVLKRNVGIVEFTDNNGHKWILKEHKKISN